METVRSITEAAPRIFRHYGVPPTASFNVDELIADAIFMFLYENKQNISFSKILYICIFKLYKRLKNTPATIRLDEATARALVDREPEPEYSARLAELHEVLERAINQLPTKQAIVIRAYFSPPWSHWLPHDRPYVTGSEIASFLNIKKSTFFVLLKKALVNLREYLGQAEYGPEDF
jgi:hypothetical protein